MNSSILVVDDDETIRGLLKAVLEGQGYRVVTAEDGAVGLQKLESGRFELMITDLHMPRLDGYGLIAQALQLRPELPIVVLSADTTLASIDQVFHYAVKAFLPKPFDDIDEVAARVETVISMARSHKNLRAKLGRAQEMLSKATKKMQSPPRVEADHGSASKGEN